jgi:hypothetical protein
MSIIDEILIDASTHSRYFINDWHLGQIFSFIPVIMVLYIYKYWSKMLKRSKFFTIYQGTRIVNELHYG